jgi:quinoprotein relay system zinc metallohydrolase 2
VRVTAAGLLALVLAWTTAAPAAEPLETVEVAAGVFVHQGPHEDFTPANGGGIANLAFVVGGEAVAVIDSGGSLRQGEALLAAVRARTDKPVRYVIATHVHPDHLFGHAAFRDGDTIFVGHANLAQRLAENAPYYLANLRRLVGEPFAGTEAVAPTLEVADRLDLDLGGRVLELRGWPAAHTDTDLTVLDSATGTLFTGDLVFMERIPVVDGSLLGWLRVMDELERQPAARVVPGHGPASAPWPGASRPQRAYLEYLRDTLRAELARNRTLEQAVDEVPPPPGSAWLLAEDNHGRNVTAAFTELEWE